MLRRRLLSIVGALGLVGGLLSSGVAAQAATAGPDSTYNALLAAYLYSPQSTCYSNVGGAVVLGSTCTIEQNQSSQRNIAVCVQSSNAVDPAPIQTCSIKQTNVSFNNYALVIQRIQQSTCAAAEPCQMGTQAASIQQTDGSGWNFGGAFQTTIQSIGQRNDPTQSNSQTVKVILPSTGPGGLEQLSTTGSNYAAVTQFSVQSAITATTQTQTADQVAGSSGIGSSGIDQHAPAGSNAAALVHHQTQHLDAAPNQKQTATQDGDITQNGLPGMNLAAGTQTQDQLERGPLGAIQQQVGDPKCCSVQNGGAFFVRLKTVQRAFAGGIFNPAPIQSETLVGNCDSVGGSCDVFLSATEQGNPPKTNMCTTSPCHIEVQCLEGICDAFNVPPPSPSLVARRTSVASRGLSVGRLT
jgi:hypothetical protein